MAEFRRARHRKVARVLASLDAKVLARAQCYFGGGTRIALELDEYRESEDIDFICSDLAGYRQLRSMIQGRSLGELMPSPKAGVSLMRDLRADQYGIRTVFSVDGDPVKFEIILEARIRVAAMTLKKIAVPVLDRVSCFAEKWLANADRWSDTAVLNRDVIDLAFMLRAWSPEEAEAGAKLAAAAYGDTVLTCARAAATRLIEDIQYRRHCVDSLAIDDGAGLLAGLKQLIKFLKKGPGA